ncbi:MAG: type 1 glutamine amidotransferase domain-containing protein [Bacteroidia bacterium]|nr:type 1 glutamine amidotransferase domain-containing protein [Bacteroidia bacterium]
MPLPHKSSHRLHHFDLTGYKALVITTSQASLDKVDGNTGKVLKKGKQTGVYASELTEAYYAFVDSKMTVDVASIQGGKIPIEKLSLRPFVRTRDDERFLKDEVLQQKVDQSLPIQGIDFTHYDIVFLSGGWGAAYDFAQSQVLAEKIGGFYANKGVIGAVCHGPLGLTSALKPDGTSLVEGVQVTGVTNKQIRQLGVGETPKHPETELRNSGGIYSSKSGLIDIFQNHVVVDQAHQIVTGQNQKAAVQTAEEAMRLLIKKKNLYETNT